MRGRTIGAVLAGLGAFLLVAGLLLPLLVVPRLEVAPLDQSSDTISTGTVDYLDIDAGEQRTDRDLVVLQRVRGDTEAGTSDVAVYDYFTRLTDPADTTPVGDGTAEQAQLITASDTTVPFDRTSGAAVDDPPEYGGPDDLEGQQFKLPFDVQEDGGYELFDATLRQAVPLQRDGEETVQGLDVWRYTASVEPTPIGEPLTLPGSLAGRAEDVTAQAVYSDERTVLVEPRTGVIIDVSDNPLQELRVGGVDGELVATALDASFSRDDDSVAASVETATDARSGLRLVGTILPIVLVVLGLLLLAVGIPMGLRGGRDPDDEEYEDGRLIDGDDDAQADGRARHGDHEAYGTGAEASGTTVLPTVDERSGAGSVAARPEDRPT